MPSSRDRRISTLTAAAQRRTHVSNSRAQEAIRAIVGEGDELTFRSVAKKAGLSLSYLYKQPALRRQIETARSEQRNPRHSNERVPAPMNEESRSAVMVQLKKRIRELECERDELRKQVQLLTGQVYEAGTDRELIERLRQENARLTAQIATFQQTASSSQSVGSTNEHATSIRIFEASLTSLGVHLSTSLRAMLQTAPRTSVQKAIDVVGDAVRAGQVRSPTRLFIRALQQGWEPEQTQTRTPDTLALREFSRWFDLARKHELVKASKGTERGIMVLTVKGKWVPYPILSSTRGWTFEELSRRQPI